MIGQIRVLISKLALWATRMLPAINLKFLTAQPKQQKP